MAGRFPDDAVVVIRGGLHSLDADKVVDDATDSFLRHGYYATTFAALDGEATRTPERRTVASIARPLAFAHRLADRLAPRFL